MAEVTFDQLLKEQKNTTKSLDRLGETLRKQLMGDEKSDEQRGKFETQQKNADATREKDARRVAAGRKAWETRQKKQNSFLGRMSKALNFLPSIGETKSQKKEKKKDEQSFLRKTFGKLGDTFKSGFESLKGVLGKFKDTALTGLKAFLVAAGLFALIKFLESDTWKKIREIIQLTKY